MRLFAQNAFALLVMSLICAAQPSPPPAGTQQQFNRAHDLFVTTSSQLLKDMDRNKARAGYQRVIQIDPRYPPAWFNLGVLAEAASEWKEATTDFQRYMAIAPDGAYAKRAKRELALIADRSAHPIPIQQQQYDATITRARTLLSAKFYKEAVAEAASAQVIDDSRWESYAVVCLVMIQQNKADEAARFRELALARTPQELKNKVSDTLSDPAK